MAFRITAAASSGQLAGLLSRALGRGGGTAIAGLVAEKLHPGILADLAGQIPLGSAFVTGTNGKTTTSRMIAHLLRQHGWEPLHNRSGSNLTRGLVTALLGQGLRGGKLAAGAKTIGLFEVDEAVLPIALGQVPPRVVVLLNLFRDQLDRYGEVDSVAAAWRRALDRLGKATTLVLNADDPLVASLGEGFAGPVIYFGLNDASAGRLHLPHAADSKWCYRCGEELDYTVSYFGHIGHYACHHCGTARPAPDVAAESLHPDGFAGTRFHLRAPTGEAEIELPVPGLYNVYNALAATALAQALEVPLATVAESLQTFTAAFGRLEKVDVEGRTVYLVLAKNPVGFTEVLNALFAGGEPKNVLLVLNDLIADGRDVSWIWDVEFELLQGKTNYVLASGVRAEDMALRLRYAGIVPLGAFSPVAAGFTRLRRAPGEVGPPAPTANVPVEPNLGRALDEALAQVPPGDTLYALMTYTAMLEMRSLLAKRGCLRPHWEVA